MNPEKLRTNYGKLTYMLQDSSTPEASGMLGFSLVKPVNSVYDYLKEHRCEDLLREPGMTLATMTIIPDGKSRAEIQHQIKQKETKYKTHAYSNP